MSLSSAPTGAPATLTSAPAWFRYGVSALAIIILCSCRADLRGESSPQNAAVSQIPAWGQRPPTASRQLPPRSQSPPSHVDAMVSPATHHASAQSPAQRTAHQIHR
ncbi:MAG: hypothetical protein AAF961_00940, partial [Planctomycetota bacterium]